MPRILLIEADRQLAANLSQIFKKRGHTVDWQVQPQAAISRLDKQIADLIILDLVLAGRSGVEFLYELRSYPEWQGIPVVLYSHVAEAELPEDLNLKDLGVVTFHHKPVTSLDELAGSVDQALKQTTK